MKFIKIEDQAEAGEILAKKIGEYLGHGKKVLWLLSGGSNITSEVEILNILKRAFGDNLKENLAVTLTDERYGNIGHADSNWIQLLQNGFDISTVRALPVLCGLEPNETVIKFGKNYCDLEAWADVIIGQFGIGSDGHTAGVLPDTIGVTAPGTAYFYDGGKYQRITLTLKTIRNVDIAYIFAFGESKKEVVEKLKNEDLTLDEMPAQILKEIEESYLYSDLV
jgi:6-phosphogluconolactonase/glucosamine-6-phosphate isomerase/deaminase